MKRVQLVTSIHGNEPLPVMALASIGEPQIVANPKALAKNVRFVETDMNSSFNTGGNTYEEKRASEVLRLLDRKKLVVDIHTFSAESEPFTIIVDLNMLEFAKTLGFRKIVYMKHNIKKGRALINVHDGVSVEVGSHKDPKSFKRTVDLVKRLKSNAKSPASICLYEVYGIIQVPGIYTNFKIHRDGFIPILAGENAYDFSGLKARIIK